MYFVIKLKSFCLCFVMRSDGCSLTFKCYSMIQKLHFLKGKRTMWLLLEKPDSHINFFDKKGHSNNINKYPNTQNLFPFITILKICQSTHSIFITHFEDGMKRMITIFYSYDSYGSLICSMLQKNKWCNAIILKEWKYTSVYMCEVCSFLCILTQNVNILIFVPGNSFSLVNKFCLLPDDGKIFYKRNICDDILSSQIFLVLQET